jgi:vacuolar protein sorting-associated protein 18
VSLQSIFTNYLNVPEEARDFEEMPSKLTYSQLDFIQNHNFAKAFGWLTDIGVTYGELNQIANNPNFIKNKKTLTFPEQSNDYHTSSYISAHSNLAPLSFVLTDFHLLLQYSDHITGISLVSHEVVYDEYFAEQYGKLMSIVKDSSNGNIYTYSNKTIFRYRVKRSNTYHLNKQMSNFFFR